MSGGGVFSSFERMVAFRYLRSRRSDNFISIIAWFSFLGIALGVAVLIIVMSVMNGFRTELLGKILGLNGHLLVQGMNGELYDFDNLADRVRGIPGIVRVAPIVDGEVLASGRGISTGSLVRGMRAEDLKGLEAVSEGLRDNGIPDMLMQPRLPGGAKPTKAELEVAWASHRAQILERFQGENAVIIGAGLAGRLGLLVGDSIRITSPTGAQTPFGITPRSKTYEVIGLFQIGMSEFDSRVIFMPLEEAQYYFNLGEAVTALEIMVADPDAVVRVRTPLRDAIDGPERIVDWQQLNSSFVGALKVERNVMFLILTMIIVVAAFNVISGLMMFVKDKGQDIAILRTMGATSSSVMRIFFMAGASIGVFGTLGGLIMGTAFCLNIENIRQFLQGITGWEFFPEEIYFLSELPAEMNVSEVMVVAGISLVISFLATIYPAWRAARLDPVDALRYE